MLKSLATHKTDRNDARGLVHLALSLCRSNPPGSLGAALKSSLKGLSVAQTNLFVLMSPALNVAPE